MQKQVFQCKITTFKQNRLGKDTLDAFTYDNVWQKHTKQQPKVVLNTNRDLLKSKERQDFTKNSKPNAKE